MPTALVPTDMLQKADKILFILNLAIGDWCYLQNCFRALSAAYPHLAIHIWTDKVWRSASAAPKSGNQAKPALYDWLSNSPFVKKTYETHSDDLYQQSVIEAKKEQYPIIVSLATVHSHQYALFARNISPAGFIVGIKDKTRFWQLSRRHAYNALNASLLRVPDQFITANFHISEVYAHWFYQLFALDVIEPDRFPFVDIPDIWIKSAQAHLASYEICRDDRIIFINAFAQDRKRSWDLEQVAHLIRGMAGMDEYKDAWFVFSSMPENVGEVDGIINQYGLKKTLVFSAIDNFFQLPAMLSQCDLIITVETSIMHLSTALGIPLVAMMRQKNPEWVPIGNKDGVVVADKRNHWVKDIPVEKVISALKCHIPSTKKDI